jgi:branched-chain amino acid transport system ATP-binding protein
MSAGLNAGVAPPVLQVRDLARSFGGLRAVDGLSFDVGAGEIVGLLGPNGSGKTTALNLISGALRPDRGSVRFQSAGGEQELAGAPPHRIARAGIAAWR